MSEIKEKLIGPKNVRTQILKVALLSIVLIVAFAFSTLLFNVLFGSLRNVPSTPYNDADYEDLIETPIPIPFNLSDLLDFFQDLDINVTQEMLETLLDMYDGNFDGIPLEDLAALMGAMMFSDVEVFRVYNYTTPLADMEKYLWKYECYDQYASGTWSASVGENNYNFYTSAEYENNPLLNPDNLTIKILNITPDAGQNQITLPTLFPTPYIMENSVNATNIDYGTLFLRKQSKDLNGTALRAEFTASAITNLTYQLVGEYLPSDAAINSSCVKVTNPNAEYSALLNDYLQLDGGSMANFISNHPDFATHYTYLYNNVILPGDNAFEIADKIRNYLQYNFNLSYNPVPPSEADQDPINWFSKSQEGMYSDFASMFVALTRAFGVASRFVDGFNSRFVEPFFDPIEGNGFAVKYQNLYSWSEVFIPTDIYGDGYWTQIDVLFENFMGNPAIPVFGNTSYSLNVKCNGLGQPLYPYVNRGALVNVTATLYNESTPMTGETITFTDFTSGETIGSEITNTKGEASVFVPIYDNMTVGPHVIVAQYNPQVANFSCYVINDTIIVDLTLVAPPSINVSDPSNNTIQVQGRVYDPLNNNGVPYSVVDITLLYNNTNISVTNAFNPPSITTDGSGIFNANLVANEASIYNGDYDVRADINGVYNYTVMWYGTPINIPVYTADPTNSSQRFDLHIDKELTGTMLFFVNNKPSNYPQLPTQSSTAIVSRGSFLGLKVVVLNETGGPVSNVAVDFFNYTGGNTIIGSNNTNQNGITTFIIFVGSSSLAGPNLIYAKAGNLINYSYYIINESPDITVMSGPSPLVINKTQGDTFTITGYLNDSVNSRPLNYSDVELRIFRNNIDYTSNLIGNPNPFTVDSYGKFDVTFGVDSTIPPGNYSLRLDFNGTYDLTTFPYDVYFSIPFINASITLINQLQITYEAPTILDFWINGTTSDDYSNPSINRYDDLNLTVRLFLGDTPLSGENIEFYDMTNDTVIGSNVTDINGYATFLYSTDYYSIAGPHLIYARYNSYYNYSYFILNAPINVTLDPCPLPSEINSTTIYGRTFAIIGDLQDGTNGANIGNGEIEIKLYDGLTEYYYYLIPTGSQQSSNFFYCDDTGEILALFNVSSALPEGNYTVTVNFNGRFYYNHPLYGPFTYILPYLSDSTNCSYQLKVSNPLNANISLIVNGSPVPADGIYPNFPHPSIVHLGENITFEGYVYQYGALASGMVDLYDIYDNPGSPIMSSNLVSGYYNFELNTSLNGFHSGLHLIKVVFNNLFDDVFNSTYIIINETFTINININPTNYNIIRNGPGFTISGKCQDVARYLRGMEVTLHLIDSMGQDKSGYLVFSGSNYSITNDNGDYSFNIIRISIDCPQGSYTLRVDFNGTISRNTDIPLIIGITGAMNSISSPVININITAGTSIIEQSWYTDYEIPPYDQQWVYNTTLYVNGRLIWDNGSAIQNVLVTVYVQYLNGTRIATNSSVLTVVNGDFSGTFFIDLNWPDYRYQTEIWVEYTPVVNFVQSAQLEFTDW